MSKNKFLKLICRSVNYYLWILLIFSTVSLLYDPVVAAVEYAVLIFFAFVYYFNNYKKKKKLIRYVHSLAYNGESPENEPLEKFPLPVVILEPSGKIIWNNKSFLQMIGTDYVYNLRIDEYIPELNTDALSCDGNAVSMDLFHNDRYYHVFGNISVLSSDDKNNDYYVVLYWEDITEHEKLKRTYANEQFVSCIIVVDNYEEVVQDTPNQDKPKLTATIEEKLQKFAESANGILRKYEKDRFFFYFQKQYLDQYTESKFRILDEIKEIHVGNTISPTLSIGVGVGGDTMAANEAYSFSALDMAFGRGGDQAIIKDAEQYHFYGGKSSGYEKRTRVKSRVVAYAIRELLNDTESVFVMGHARADVDVLGSALGIYRAVKALGKNAYIIIDRENQTVAKFIKSIESEYRGVFISKANALDMAERSSLLFVVDTHKKSLVEEPELLKLCKRVVVIDHHRRSTDFIENPIILYHEPYASSASELVTEVVQYIDSNIRLNQHEAEALYAGIYMDTKSFAFKTGVRTFEAASYLRRCGVDSIKIKKLFQVDMNTFKKRLSIIENATIIRGMIAIAACEKNDKDMPTIVAQATDELLNISNVNTSFVLCDMGDTTIISGRSLGDINVQVILEKLGGGGHMTIAGAQLKGVGVVEASDRLYKAIDEYFDNNN